MKSEVVERVHRLIEIVCHKGANIHAPENTFAAAQLCVDWGVDYVEIDINTSRDGVMYLFHGPGVDDTTNGKGLFRHHMAKEIDRFDAGSWFSPRFTNERVPRLSTFLSWIKGRAKVFFDVKAANPEQLLHLIEDAGLQNDCFFWSGDDQMARTLRALDSDLQLKINVSRPADVEKAAEQYQANIVEVGIEQATPDLIQTCRDYGIKVMVYHQQNTPNVFRRILDLGVEMINLNHGDAFIRTEQAYSVERGKVNTDEVK